MEPPRIGCQFPGVFNPPATTHGIGSPPLVSVAAAAAGIHENGGKPAKPVLLRRVSQSSPHLDVPHFLNSQENGFNSLQHVLSGLIDGSNRANNPPLIPHSAQARPGQPTSLEQTANKLGSSSVPVANTQTMPSSPDLTPFTTIAPERKPSLDRNRSASELATTANSESVNVGGLRKVASIANYNLGSSAQTTGSESASVTPNTSSGHLASLVQHLSHLNPVGSHHHHSFNTIPEDENDKGLMMSVGRPSSSLAAAAGARQGVIESAASSSVAAAGAGADAATAATSPPKSAFGGVMGVFGRGFFAKPAMRSEEENYRYILALDRN